MNRWFMKEVGSNRNREYGFRALINARIIAYFVTAVQLFNQSLFILCHRGTETQSLRLV